MPDLPELYDALDSATSYLLRIASEEKPHVDSLSTQSQFVSALCAAIEVKQTQEALVAFGMTHPEAKVIGQLFEFRELD